MHLRTWLSVFTGIIIFSPCFIEARKHFLTLEDDPRRLIQISTFGFFKRGLLEVHVHEFSIRSNIQPVDKIGFTVDRTLSGGINPYSPNLESSRCALINDTTSLADHSRFSRVVLLVDTQKKKVRVSCDPQLDSLVIYRKTSDVRSLLLDSGIGFKVKRDTQESDPEVRPPTLGSSSPASRPREGALSDQKDVPHEEIDPNQFVPDANLFAKPKAEDAKKDDTPSKLEADPIDTNGDGGEPSDLEDNGRKAFQQDESKPNVEDTVGLPDPDGFKCGKDFELDLIVRKDGDRVIYSFNFTVFVETQTVEGLYNLYFHNCLGDDMTIDLNMSITEENEGGNYLSAGEMPLPALYFMMSIIFFISGCFWVFILKKSRKEANVAVFKIHYLMGVLVFVKSLSLLFHSINYHYIQTMGTHLEGFAVLYYTVHLLKGALLFITLLLIGTGYAFIKHLLSDKEKRIFMIIIPLQVLANVANIIIEESEEAELKYVTWKVIFYSLDLLCCGAILFPVIWSIRHLQEASGTDGKAATNLRKLKLFRHFYIIVVCYIYFTRIIVNLLLKITIQFQYEWLDEMFLELATFIFYVLVGYKFRPAANNPYLELAHDSDDEGETDVALTESGLLAGVSKRGHAKKKTLKEIVYFDDDSDDDEEVLLENRGEVNSSSKDFVSMTMSKD